MPTRTLTSQAGRTGLQRAFNFGGGADRVFAIDDGVSAFGYIINGRGGNNTIYGSDSVFGDLLIGGNGSDSVFGGGGDDTIHGGNLDGSDSSKGQRPPPTNILVGDGERQLDGSLTADVNFIDGATVFDGGDDTVTGGVGATLNRMFGDADDVNMLVAGLTFNGGDDDLTGGDGSITNSMFGDADRLTMVDGSTFNGGDDTLRAGDGGNNTMVGDAAILIGDGTVNGGNDTLISGTGNDVMIGDFGSSGGFIGAMNGGADTFVFAQNFGFDSIADFEVGSDTINLFATGLTLFSDLDSNGDFILDGDDLGVTIVVNPITNVSTTQIDFGVVTGETFQGFLTISGVTGLMATDFDFTTDLFV